MRFYNLQLVRFLASLLVILFHVYHTDNILFKFLIGKGDFAVSVFFVLSGFVISSSLIRKRVSFRNYLYRRLLKIMPLWWFSIVFVSLGTGGVFPEFYRTVTGILLLQGIYSGWALDLNFVGWSLSVELLAYVLMFFVISRINVISKRFVLLVTGMWLLTQVLFILVLKNNESGIFSDFFTYYHPIWHLNEFFIGITINYFLINSRKRKINPLITTLFYCGILVTFFFLAYKLGQPRLYHNGFLAPLTAIFFIMLIQSENMNDSSEPSLKQKLFNLGGNISFGMYLLHIPLFYVFRDLFDVTKLSGSIFFIYLTLLLGLCYITFILFDTIPAKHLAFSKVSGKRNI